MKKLINILIGVAAGLINGFFGAGGGLVSVPLLTKYAGLSQKKAQATTISIILPISVTSVFIYMSKPIIDYRIALPLILGGLIGTPIGVFIFKKVNPIILKKIFGVFMIVSAIRILL